MRRRGKPSFSARKWQCLSRGFRPRRAKDPVCVVALLLWNRFCYCDVFLQRKQHVFGHSHGHTLGSVRGRLKQQKERSATPSFLHGKPAFRQAWLPCWRFCCGSWRFPSRNTYVSAASGTVAGCLDWADWLAGWSPRIIQNPSL